eukprot:779363-Prymnesium_polylepis.2
MCFLILCRCCIPDKGRGRPACTGGSSAQTLGHRILEPEQAAYGHQTGCATTCRIEETATTHIGGAARVPSFLAKVCRRPESFPDERWRRETRAARWHSAPCQSSYCKQPFSTAPAGAQEPQPSEPLHSGEPRRVRHWSRAAIVLTRTLDDAVLRCNLAAPGSSSCQCRPRT